MFVLPVTINCTLRSRVVEAKQDPPRLANRTINTTPIKHFEVAIIGGGFSGVAVAVHLLRESHKISRAIKVCLFEPRDTVGAGLAYGTRSLVHILNVPAAKMGIDEKIPDAFHSWLVKHSYKYSREDFVPRHLYHQYLLSELGSAMGSTDKNTVLEIFRDSVSEIRIRSGEGYILRTKEGGEYGAKNVVIAMGNSLNSDGARSSAQALFRRPWDPEAIGIASSAHHVAIVGSGLTAVDTILELEEAGFGGSYTVISRKGRLPEPYPDENAEKVIAQNVIALLKSANSLRELLRIFRSSLKSGISSYGLVDALRPFSQDIWQRLTAHERKRFMRHLRPYWTPLRHRIPLSSWRVIEKLKIRERLRVIERKVLSCENADGKKWLNTSPHFTNTSDKCSVGPFDLCFDCMGLWPSLRNSGSSVIESLLTGGLASLDELSLGLRATSSGELLDADGKIVSGLFTLGSLRRGELWETTAVRELRQQASEITRVIIGIEK